MFGYVLLNPRSASEEEKKRYTLYYCGLCNALGSSCGKSSTRTLSYDMTFLYILLADLYNQEGTVRKAHCPVHPLTKREYMESPAAAYCADMQILLSYYSAMDKYRDEHSAKALAFMHRHEEKVREIEARYPRQREAVRTNLAKLADCEAEKSEDAVIASGCFASLLGEVFAPYEDIWYPALKIIGQGVGRFIYILDAYDDLEKDRKKGLYNPYFSREKDESLRNEVEQVLTLAASSAAEAMEKLPLNENLSIVRNVLYSGIWTKFVRKGQK